MRARACVLALAALGASSIVIGCARPPPDATPEGAVRLWLERMEESADDRRAAREAFALLGPKARANLEERAARASRVHGRQVEPYEMLAEGRFGLRFRPLTTSATRNGDDAMVEVVGGAPGERANVRCRFDGAGWRVEPNLPDLAPLTHREDGGT